MGSEKHLLPFPDRPLLEHLIDCVEPAVSQIIVSGKTKPVMHRTDVESCADEFSVESALAGIHAGLAASRLDWCFIMACDLPFVEADVIRWLASRRTVAARAVVPVKNQFWEPLCALYHRSCLPLIRQMIETSDLEIKHLYSRVPTVTAPVEEIESALHSHVFFNMNNQSDYESALQIHRSLLEKK